MVIDGLKALLVNEAEIDICGAFTDATEAMTFLDSHEVDVVMTDLDMPTMSGEDVLLYCKSKFPYTKVVVLSMHNESAIIKHLVDSGADGYLLKSSGKEEILACIKLVHTGVKHFSDDVLKAVMNNNQVTTTMNPALNDLTNREIEMVKLVATGLNSKDIAEQLNISIRTVETHRRNILKKIDGAGVAGIIRFAFENKLVN